MPETGGPVTLGLDVGSSAVKVCLYDVISGRVTATAVSPATGEIRIDAPYPGWAEQSPDTWWSHVVDSCHTLARQDPDRYRRVAAIGISYQEHGLVLLDGADRVLRPAIIWCDSRTAEIAETLVRRIGAERWRTEVANLPGNFTVSKLAWVQHNRPDLFAAARRWLLPGDYIALRLTGCATTTHEGLSEALLYSFRDRAVATALLEDAGLGPSRFPDAQHSFGDQGLLRGAAATELGLPPDARVTFRAGDQHANAVGLGVVGPGHAAVAAGTSGVVFAVSEQPVFDSMGRVNAFLHVTSETSERRCVTVLCINAVGIVFAWVRRLLAASANRLPDYDELNALIAATGRTLDGPIVLPFGNGAERMLANRAPGFTVSGVDLNRHGPGAVARAALEGVVCAFRYGYSILSELGVAPSTLSGGHAGLFRSVEFTHLLSSALGVPIHLFDSDPATGAALGAAVGAELTDDLEEALRGRAPTSSVEPTESMRRYTTDRYDRWSQALESSLRL